MYCSFTHFRVKAWWAVPLFQWHAFRSGSQAYRAKGLVHMKTRAADMWNYQTLTVWMQKEDMLKFRNNGAHLQAMKLSNRMGKGYTVGWESRQIPNREDGEKRLEDKLQKDDLAVWLSA